MSDAPKLQPWPDPELMRDRAFFLGIFAGWHMLLAGAGLMMRDGFLVAYATAATGLFAYMAFKRKWP